MILYKRFTLWYNNHKQIKITDGGIMYTFLWGRKPSNIFTDAAKLRTEIFVDEQGFVNELDDTDARAEHLVVYSDDKPIAVARIFTDDPAKKVWHAGRICVAKAMRGKGVGKEIMTEIKRRAKTLGAEEIELSAQVRVSGFYAACGYKKQGEVYLDEYCEHILMKNKLGEKK